MIFQARAEFDGTDEERAAQRRSLEQAQDARERRALLCIGCDRPVREAHPSIEEEQACVSAQQTAVRAALDAEDAAEPKRDMRFTGPRSSTRLRRASLDRMASAPGKALHGYVGESRQLEVFRNPRKHQTRMSRWVLYRCSNKSSDFFTSCEDARVYGSKLNPKVEWRVEDFEGSAR